MQSGHTEIREYETPKRNAQGVLETYVVVIRIGTCETRVGFESLGTASGFERGVLWAWGKGK
jgi:hypothetical protein